MRHYPLSVGLMLCCRIRGQEACSTAGAPEQAHRLGPVIGALAMSHLSMGSKLPKISCQLCILKRQDLQLPSSEMSSGNTTPNRASNWEALLVVISATSVRRDAPLTLT